MRSRKSLAAAVMFVLLVLIDAHALEAADGAPEPLAFLGTVPASGLGGSAKLGSLRGELRDWTPLPLLPDPGATLRGAFARGAISASDLRFAPLAASFTAPDGTLEASARGLRKPRGVDLATGRPLRPGAPPGATCATGAEPNCMAPSDAPAANRAAFDALCALTAGFSSLDRSRCALDVFRSQAGIVGIVNVAQLLSQLLAGSASGVATVAASAFLGPAARIPLVSLGIDPGDGTPTGPFSLQGPNFALPGFATANHNLSQTLAQVLTSEQQALLGCGPFNGATCDGGVAGHPLASGPGGIDLLHADAGALLQSFAPVLDESFLATDATRVQPGTAGSTAPECDRDAPGGDVALLPGCRGPADPGYDPATDGPNPALASIGFPAGQSAVPPLGNPVLGPIAFTQGHPFTGQAWRSEMAAVSWNLQAILVAFSTRSTDPTLPDPRYGFDPANAYRTTGCSYVKPQLCNSVRSFWLNASYVLAGDPEGRPSLRWAWEGGAQYAVESGTGRFAGFAGGVLFAFGPFSAGSFGAGTAAAAPPGLAALDSVLLVPPADDADGDGVANETDHCPASADPGQADTDGDGVGNACDDCRDASNPDQRDTNGDGFGNTCDPDLDGNVVVNFADLAKLKSVFFKSDPDADLDGNGVVNFADLARMKQRFFQAPGPSALVP